MDPENSKKGKHKFTKSVSSFFRHKGTRFKDSGSTGTGHSESSAAPLLPEKDSSLSLGEQYNSPGLTPWPQIRPDGTPCASPALSTLPAVAPASRRGSTPTNSTLRLPVEMDVRGHPIRQRPLSSPGTYGSVSTTLFIPQSSSASAASTTSTAEPDNSSFISSREPQTQNDIHSAITGLREAIQHAKRKQWTCGKDHNGEPVPASDRMLRILKGVEDYAKIIDVAIQHNPEVTSLVWAGVRSILLIALYRVELMENLELAMLTIVQTMAIGEFYHQIYTTTSWSTPMLGSPVTAQAFRKMFDTALHELYRSIQDFTEKARKYIDPDVPALTKFGNLFKPFAIVMKPMIDAISEKEEALRACAEIATMKRIQEASQQLYQLRDLVSNLSALMEPISRLDDVLNGVMENAVAITELRAVATENLDTTRKVLKITTDTQQVARDTLGNTAQALATGTRTLHNTEDILALSNQQVNTGAKTLDITTQTHSVAVANAGLATRNLSITKHVQEAVIEVDSQLKSLAQHQEQTLFKEAPLESQLQELKEDYLAINELMEEFSLDLYIPARGMAHPRDPERSHFDLQQKIIQAFLSPESLSKVCLLQGVAGSGKSTFNHALARELWMHYGTPDTADHSARVPIFISLASLHDPSRHNQDLLGAYFNARGISEKHIKELRATRKFVFILDGFDEIENRDSNFYSTNRLGDWNAKVVVTSRPEYLSLGYQSKFHPPGQQYLLQEYWIAPFSRDIIKEYIKRYVTAKPTGWSEEEYGKLLAQPEVAELISNPFLLRMVMTVTPEKGHQNIERSSLYKHFINHWIDQARNRLQNIQLSVPQRTAFARLCDEDFGKHVLNFCQQLAVALYRDQSVEATYDGTRYQAFGATGSHDETIPKEQLIWKKFLSNDNDHTRLLRFSSPLIRNQQTYRFIHKSIRDYLIAQSMWSDTKLGQTQALLNEFYIVNDYGILEFIVQEAMQDESFRNHCLSYLEQSKSGSEVQRAAANAITILARTGFSFAGFNLDGIRIRGANVSNAWFDHCSFRAADLRSVIFSGAWLREADFSEANLDGVQFGERPSLEIQGSPLSFCFSPDNAFIAVSVDQSPAATEDGIRRPLLQIWSLETHHQQATIPVSSPNLQQFACIAISPDGTQLAAGGDDGKIYMFSIMPGNGNVNIIMSMQPLKCHRQRVTSIAYSPIGGYLASASTESTVRLWKATDGSLLHSFKGHFSSVNKVTFSPDGSLLASASTDFSIRLWSANGLYECVHKFNLSMHAGPDPRSIAFSPDGNVLAMACDHNGRLRFWSVEHKQQIDKGFTNTKNQFVEHTDLFAFSPDGQFLVTTSRMALSSVGPIVYLWSIAQKGLVHMFQLAQLVVGSVLTDIAFSPDSQIVAVGSDSYPGEIQLLPITQKRHGVHPPRMDRLDVNLSDIVAVSPDGNLLATISWAFSMSNPSCKCELWSLQDSRMKFESTMLASDGMTGFSHLSFSPQDNLQLLLGQLPGRNLAFISVNSPSNDDNSTWQLQAERVWNLPTQVPNSIAAISPDGKLFATRPSNRELDGKLIPSEECDIQIWSIQDERMVTLLQNSNIDGPDTCPVAFSSDSTLLVSTRGNNIHLWSAITGDCINIFQGHDHHVTFVVFAPSGEFLASCSQDGMVKVWCVDREQGNFKLQNTWNSVIDDMVYKPYGLDYSRDGQFLAGLATSTGLDIPTNEQFPAGLATRTGFDHRTSVLIWAASSGKLLCQMRGNEGNFVCMRWVPKDRIVVGTMNAVWQLWEIERVVGVDGSLDSVSITVIWSSSPPVALNVTDAIFEGALGLDSEDILLLEQKHSRLTRQQGEGVAPQAIRVEDVEEMDDDEEDEVEALPAIELDIEGAADLWEMESLVDIQSIGGVSQASD